MNTTLDTPTIPKPSNKISFGGIAKKAEKAKAGDAYPVYYEPQVAALAARIRERQDQFEVLEGQLKTDKADLRALVSPFYFTTNHGKAVVPSSIRVPIDDPNEPNPKPGAVLVTFQNRYPAVIMEEPIRQIIGDKVDEYFRQKFIMEVDGDKLPADRAQELVERIQALFTEFNCTAALSVKDALKPKDDFHTRRHMDLTPEVNLAIDQVCAIVAPVKTKNVK